MKRLYVLITVLIILLVFYVIFLFIPRSYTVKYFVDKVTVTEIFDKETSYYTFEFYDGNNRYSTSFDNKYISGKKIVNHINVVDNCITPSSKSITFYTMCKNNDVQVLKSYNDNVYNTVIDTYNGINIYDLNNNKYFIWKYTGFDVVGSKNDTINIFNTDVYNLDLVVTLDNNIILGDYNQKYMFDKFYVVNMKNNKVSNFKVNRTIYFDSYILGTYKDSFYLYDVNSEKMYRINPNKKKLYKAQNSVLVNDDWENISTYKLNKKTYKFTNDEVFKFELVDNKLYYETSKSAFLVTSLSVSEIIKSTKEDVYFISGNTLYYANIYDGLKKILSYDEWDFNRSNIYIYETD